MSLENVIEISDQTSEDIFPEVAAALRESEKDVRQQVLIAEELVIQAHDALQAVKKAQTRVTKAVERLDQLMRRQLSETNFSNGGRPGHQERCTAQG